MKKIFLLTLVMGMATILSGCGFFDLFVGGGSDYMPAIDELSYDDEEVIEGETVDMIDEKSYEDLEFEQTVKNNCGGRIDYRYCKCTFHREHCKDLGVSRGEAREYLEEQFEQLVEEDFDAFATACHGANGYMQGDSCQYCPADAVANRGTCIFPTEDVDDEDDGEEIDEEEAKAEETPVEIVAEAEAMTYTEPDFATTMKNKCGASIEKRYCKCAFHETNCDQIGLDAAGATAHLRSIFDTDVVDAQLDAFATTCEDKGHVWDAQNNTCFGCPAGTDFLAGDCVQEVVVDEGDKETEDVDDSEEPNEEPASCKRDEDCASICEGNVSWEMGCTASTDTCVKTFDTDCSQLFTTRKVGADTFQVPGMCEPDVGCIQDVDNFHQQIDTQKNAVQEERKAAQASYQHMTNLYQQAADICLQQLSDVTNKLIIDTAFLIQNPPAGVIDILSIQTATAMDLAINAGQKSSEESIAQRCGLEQQIKTIELPLLEKKQQILLQRVKDMDLWLDYEIE